MTITYRASSSGGNATGTDVSVTKPTGTVDGDILVAVLYREGGTWTLPSGWTQSGSDQASGAANFNLTCAWKIASGEPASWTFALSSSTWRIVSVSSFSTTTTGQVDTAATGANTPSSTVQDTVASISTTATNTMVCSLHGNFDGTNVTTATGYTESVDLGGCAIHYKAYSSSGATGSYNSGFSPALSGSTYWATFHIAFSESSGGTSVNKSESITVTDTDAVTLVSRVSPSESVTASDAPTVLFTRQPAVSDSVTVSDSAAVKLVSLVNKSESVTISDAPTAAVRIAVSAAESITVSDTPAVTLPVAGSVTVNQSESVTVTDALTAAIVTNVSAAESLTVSDAGTAAIQTAVSAAENITVSDAAALTLLALVNRSESITVTDAPTAAIQTAISKSESLTVSDAPALAVTLAISVAETVTLSESASALFGAAVYVTEALTVSDQPTVVMFTSYAVNVSEAIAITDAANVFARPHKTEFFRTYIQGRDRGDRERFVR